jgi:hypothetical protein
MKLARYWLPLVCCWLATVARGEDWISYQGGEGPGKGKHVVFLSGDEEYRSEEGLPMLAKILSQRHGFTCTVLFSVDSDGTIDPDNGASLSGAAALDSADAIVMLLRFRHWPDDVMQRLNGAFPSSPCGPAPTPSTSPATASTRISAPSERRCSASSGSAIGAATNTKRLAASSRCRRKNCRSYAA